DVERLLVRLGMVQRNEDALNQIGDVDEIPFYRHTLRVEHQRDRTAPDVFVRTLRPYQVPPARASKNIIAKRERVAEIVFLHDPRRPQATTREHVLDEILLYHDLFQNLRQRLAAGIRAVLLLFRNGY